MTLTSLARHRTMAACHHFPATIEIIRNLIRRDQSHGTAKESGLAQKTRAAGKTSYSRLFFTSVKLQPSEDKCSSRRIQIPKKVEHSVEGRPALKRNHWPTGKPLLPMRWKFKIEQVFKKLNSTKSKPQCNGWPHQHLALGIRAYRPLGIIGNHMKFARMLEE